MYSDKEIEDYWENNRGGESPIFPVLEYFNVDGNLHSFSVFEQLSNAKPEIWHIYSEPDPSERLLDQHGRIFKYIVHHEGFFYPKLTDEIFNYEMLTAIVEELDDIELEKFVSLNQFDDFVKKYCK